MLAAVAPMLFTYTSTQFPQFTSHNSLHCRVFMGTSCQDFIRSAQGQNNLIFVHVVADVKY
jgi:hypothetical protein